MRGTGHPEASEHFQAGRRTLSRLPPGEAPGGDCSCNTFAYGAAGGKPRNSRDTQFHPSDSNQRKRAAQDARVLAACTMPDTAPNGSNADCPNKPNSSGRAQKKRNAETGISPTYARNSRPTSSADEGNGVTHSVGSNATPEAPGLPSAGRSTPSLVARARRSERYTGASARSIGTNV